MTSIISKGPNCTSIMAYMSYHPSIHLAWHITKYPSIHLSCFSSHHEKHSRQVILSPKALRMQACSFKPSYMFNEPKQDYITNKCMYI